MAGLFSALFGFLKCLLAWVVGAAIAGVTALVNLVIAGLMAIVGPALGLLPTVDLGSVALPGMVVDAMGWVGYFLPVTFGIATALVVLTVLGVWALVAAILRWAKVAR